MDRKNITIIILLGVLIALNAWYGNKLQSEQQLKQKEQAALKAAEEAKKPKPAPAVAAAGDTAKPAAPAAAEARLHEITQGSVTWKFSSKGGGIERVVLAGHDQIVLNAQGKEAIGALRRESKLLDDTPYAVVEADAKHVVFEGKGADGLMVRKTYTLTEGEASDEHLIKLNVTLTNQGAGELMSDHHYLYTGAASALNPTENIVMPHATYNDQGDFFNHPSTDFDGGWFSREQSEISASLAGMRWAGVYNRFYVQLIGTPDKKDAPSRFIAERSLVDHSQDQYKDAGVKDWAMHAVVALAPLQLAPGATASQDFEIYAGPREYHRLAKIGRQRDFSMDYGMFGFISRAFVGIMRWLHEKTGNWGWAIVLLTIFVRTLLWPIMAKSQRAAKRMGKLSPEIAKLKEKYADDPQRMQMETMKLWKDYGVNPMSGCWPALVQIPIFFGCLFMLQPAAELRGMPFLWVKDLSLPDTITQILGFNLNPLPLLMGLTGFLQMKMIPQSPGMDKTQQRIFMMMPLVFVFFFYSFASGLALYYTTQNIFSIFQSWVMRTFSKDDDKPLVKVAPSTKPAGPSLFNFGGAPAATQAKPDSAKPKTHVPRLGGSGSKSSGK
jgi:YidC/Oxa1 family membrane protein insertase